MNKKIIRTIGGLVVTCLFVGLLLPTSAYAKKKKTSYGSITGKVTYVDYHGDIKGDTGADVFLFKKKSNTKKFEGNLAYDDDSELNKYHIYKETITDADGTYDIDHIPTGKYKIVFVFHHQLSGWGADMTDEEYKDQFMDELKGYVKKDAWFLYYPHTHQYTITDTSISKNRTKRESCHFSYPIYSVDDDDDDEWDW